MYTIESQSVGSRLFVLMVHRLLSRYWLLLQLQLTSKIILASNLPSKRSLFQYDEKIWNCIPQKYNSRQCAPAHLHRSRCSERKKWDDFASYRSSSQATMTWWAMFHLNLVAKIRLVRRTACAVLTTYGWSTGSSFHCWRSCQWLEEWIKLVTSPW